VFFSSLAGTFTFMILDQKLCFDCICIFDTPIGQINSEKIILQKHLAVFLLVTNVSQRIIIITSVQSLCSTNTCPLGFICFETQSLYYCSPSTA